MCSPVAAAEPEDIARDYLSAPPFSQLTLFLRLAAPIRAFARAFLTPLAAHASIPLCPSTQHGLCNLSNHHRTSQDAAQCDAPWTGRAHGQFWRVGYARGVSGDWRADGRAQGGAQR